MPRFEVHTKDFPAYRFVDMYHATDAYCRQRGTFSLIESEHPNESLNTILHAKPDAYVSRRIRGAARAAWAIGPRQEEYLPGDCFWVSADQRSNWLILRVRHQPLRDRVAIEVAAETRHAAEACVDAIVEISGRNSIYRNKIISIRFEAGIKDEYGDVEGSDRLSVTFKVDELVSDDDIVIDDDVRAVLRRNVVDLHQRRAVLKRHGVPVRRGVLLYGPPGTGKTFACRYLCGQLPETTRIIVAGTALLHVGSVFNLARLLQPSVVILEDVDLVFAAREINLYSSVLGELLDQMDGLRPYEDIGVILTTNAIERLEAAIKDRPGRISQCIYFGAPNDRLRRRYLERYLRGYAQFDVDFDALVKPSHGATQAFLKEWVHRAVQIAVERLEGGDAPLRLRNEDFDSAFVEMRRFSGGSTGRIIGFHE